MIRSHYFPLVCVEPESFSPLIILNIYLCPYSPAFWPSLVFSDICIRKSEKGVVKKSPGIVKRNELLSLLFEEDRETSCSISSYRSWHKPETDSRSELVSSRSAGRFL